MVTTETSSAIEMTPSGRPGRGRLLLWISTAAAAAVAVTLAIVLLAAGRSAGLDVAAGYVPADSFFYVEAQLDLPDGQRENLRGLLEQFPAATADDLLGPALAETLDAALASGDAPITYTDDIAPWFTGRVAVSINELPSGLANGEAAVPSMTFLFGTRDAAAATAVVDTLRTTLESSGVTFTSSERDGVTLWSAEAPAGTMGPDTTTLEIAVSTDQLILGVNGGGTTALDVHAGKADALAKDGDLAQSIALLPKSRVATMVIDTQAVLAMSPYPSPLPSAVAAALAATPDAVVASLSFEADAIRMDTASGPLPDSPRPASLESDLAAEIPGDALVFFEAPGVGDSIGLSIESLKAIAAADPATAAMLDGLTDIESALGAKLEDYFDWAGGMAIAVGKDGDVPWGGLLVEVKDASEAGQRIGQLDTLTALAASDPSSGVTISHPSAAGTDYTSVRVALPADAGLPVTEVVFEYALAGDRLLIGFGDAFVGRALGLAESDSLAASDTYDQALTAVGDDASHGMVFVDLGATRTWVESFLPADVMAMYDEEIGPNLAPLDYLAAGSRMEGGFSVSTMVLKLR